MTAYVVRESFRAKSGEIGKGKIVAMSADQAKPLLITEKIAELKPCQHCNTFSWWLSIHRVLVCGVCHPPVPGAVKKWIGDPETYARMKATKPGVLLSIEDYKQGLQNAGHQDKKGQGNKL